MKGLKKTAFLALLLALVTGVNGCSSDSSSIRQGSDHGDDASSVTSPITASPDVKLENIRVQIATQSAPQKVEEPSQQARATVDDSVPLMNDYQRIQAIMAKYNVYPEPGTQFVMGSMPTGCVGADGCTQYKYYPDTGVVFDYVITIVPGQLTEYLLIHEIGHARGIRDECGADVFAKSILGSIPTHYC